MMNNKILLVLGASSDIGIEFLQQKQHEFDLIVAHYRTNSDKLNNLKKELGERLILYRADFTQQGDTKEFINFLEEKGLQPTHILHLAAIPCKLMKFHQIAWEDYQHDIDTSIRSLVMILSNFIPNMIKNKYGKIVVMLSAYVNNIPPKYLANYTMTKYALLGLTKTVAVEYGDKGITINAVSPEMVETKFLNNIPEIVIEKNAVNRPLGKNLLKEDIIPILEFLLSEQSQHINGQNIGIGN